MLITELLKELALIIVCIVLFIDVVIPIIGLTVFAIGEVLKFLNK
jgi:hypothetical protein